MHKIIHLMTLPVIINVQRLYVGKSIIYSPHSSVDLVITVTDINDNAPSFINTPYAVTILEVS